MSAGVDLGRRAVSLAGAALLIAPAASADAGVGAQPPAAGRFASWDAQHLVLSNGVSTRTLRLPGGAKPWLATVGYKHGAVDSKFFTGHDGKHPTETDEFRLLANGVLFDAAKGWRLSSISAASDALRGDGAAVVLTSLDGQIEVTLQYLLYPGLPVVRKRLSLRNLGAREVALESIEIECFNFESYWPSTMCWIYSDYGRRKSLAPFMGGKQDSLVALHNPDWGQGIVLGNEAAGVNKFTSAFSGTDSFKTGLSPKESPFPFRRHLAPGASFQTPQVFTIVYAGVARFDDILNTAVPDFVRKHMGIRLSLTEHKPHFVYNTWEPFTTDINDALVRELARAAAAAGIKEFIIDDGWQDVYGDWGVDRVKFPNGLKPVMDYIKSLGMKPGLWVSIGSADPKSRVFQQHPEWFAINSHGKRFSVHQDGDESRYTACFSTGWKEYIEGVLLRLTGELGLEYLKLDFSVVTSPYRHDTVEVGCYGKDHPGHRDQPEAMSVSYDVMWRVFDAIHARHPEVFIDCTFETMGGLQLVDYAMLQHAEGNWMSNFNEPNETNDLRVRNMAWWRSPAIPATALVLGNSKLNDPGFLLHLRSLAGALPILLGDPRKMTAGQRNRCRAFADWMARMARRHDALSFRQDLDGFGEPELGRWDGFQRINTDTRSGGIVGVFRHGAGDAERMVRVRYLDARAVYLVRDEEGREVARQSGQRLATAGFACRLPATFDGRLFEVTKFT
ncbi:MAG: alpha-galactosidase [Pseudomonadota bacterium]